MRKIHAYWRASNYLALGMTYLKANPLLKEPLKPEHVKDRLLGHWGTSPGLAFCYIHLNRVIKAQDLDVVFMAGPGHGAPGVLGPCYLEGSYSEVYPDCSEDEEGLLRLFKQFSFPGGIGSHCTPETPGSIHEGGELGYVLSHACGAAFDNPDLIVAAVVGDGESETGPLATSWHINKFLNPIRDGAVLPILHLNGYKINNPTIWARVRHDEIEAFFRGTGWTPYFVEGSDPESMHQAMAATIDKCVADIQAAQKQARSSRQAVPAALADDRAAHAQGLDEPGGGRRPQARRKLAGAPGADGRCEEGPGPAQAARRLDARLQAGGTVRRPGAVQGGTEGARSSRHAAHRLESARQRRAISRRRCGCRTSALTASRSRSPARPRPRTAGRSASSCAT